MILRTLFLSVLCCAATVSACDLCAVYNKDVVPGESTTGFSFGITEQFIPSHTVQLDDHKLSPSVLDDLFVDSSMTHLVPTWNFSDRFGVSANLPIVHKRFKRLQLTSAGVASESGTEAGIGDLALIGRATVLKVNDGKSSFGLNLLAGVKFPTGDADRVAEEVRVTRELDLIYGTGHQHAISGVHLRDLALGSGSFDGVFGVTANARVDRFFLNAQFQYYLRTPGESGYEYGDEWMVSGGPGVFLISGKKLSLGLQFVAVYDVMFSDRVLGRENQNTGMSAVYLGPQVNLAAGRRFSANAGIDLPIQIRNNGLQNVPDYRLHVGINFSF